MANQQQEDYINLSKFRELFAGRFSDQEAATLLYINQGDVKAAVALVLTSEPAEIRNRIEEEQKQWMVVEAVNKVRGHRSVLEAARTGAITTTVRLYACSPCDLYWWKRTPSRKQVSRCNKRPCPYKYDPIPREREWGWAEFHCQNCGAAFSGWCAMYMTSPCFQCGERVAPTRILPPNERGARRHPTKHACDAWDCQCKGPNPVPPPPGTPEREHRCVHPQTRRFRGLPKVVEASAVHDSSGSTVATFLPQTDLQLPRDEVVFPPPLPAIGE